MNDERLVKLQARLKNLEISCSCCSTGVGFGFAVDLPPAMQLVFEDLQDLHTIVTDLSEKMKEIDDLRATWREENLKGSASVD